MDSKKAKKLLIIGVLISSIALYLRGLPILFWFLGWWYGSFRQVPRHLFFVTAHATELMPIFLALFAVAAVLYWKLGKALLRMTCLILSLQIFVYFMEDYIELYYSIWSNPSTMHTWIMRWPLWQALLYSVAAIAGIWLFYWLITRREEHRDIFQQR